MKNKISKFDVPFIANIPIEKEQEFNEEIEVELAYEKLRENDLQKQFNNLTSNFRKVGDYLLGHLNQKISYEQISKELSIAKSSVKGIISKLNFWKGFPMTMMPVPHKKGFIQSVLESEDDYYLWDRKKVRTITTMNAVRNKAKRIVKTKFSKKKQKVKIKNITKH